jgi:hypothetical protein
VSAKLDPKIVGLRKPVRAKGAAGFALSFQDKRLQSVFGAVAGEAGAADAASDNDDVKGVHRLKPFGGV